MLMTLLLKPLAALQNVSLGVLVGGILALGAFVPKPLFSALPRPQAGALMTLMFRRFDKLVLILCCLIPLLEALLQGATLFESGWGIHLLKASLAFGLMGLGCYATLNINPQLEVLQATADTNEAFDALHAKSERLYKAVLAVAALLLALNAA